MTELTPGELAFVRRSCQQSDANAATRGKRPTAALMIGVIGICLILIPDVIQMFRSGRVSVPARQTVGFVLIIAGWLAVQWKSSRDAMLVESTVRKLNSGTRCPNCGARIAALNSPDADTTNPAASR